MRGRVSQTDAQLELQLETTQRLQVRAHIHRVRWGYPNGTVQTLSAETSVSIERTNLQLLSASNMLSQELGALASVTQEIQRNVTQLPDLIFKFNSAWLPGIFSPLSSLWNGCVHYLMYISQLSDHTLSGLRFPAWQAQLVMHVVGVGASGIQSSISVLFVGQQLSKELY